MNFNDIIKSHIEWKIKLRSYINGNSKEKLDESKVKSDKECEFGQWILNEGKKYNDNPKFKELADIHKKFHIAVGEIVHKVNSGNKEEAEKLINSTTSEYHTLSNSLISLIIKIRKELESK